MPGESDGWENDRWAVGKGAEGGDGGVAALHYFAGVAAEEDFANKFG